MLLVEKALMKGTASGGGGATAVTMVAWGGGLPPTIPNECADISSTFTWTQISSDSVCILTPWCQANFGITNTGGLYFWGFDCIGSSGLGVSNARYSIPTQVGGTSWSDIITLGGVGGIGATLGIRSSLLYGWGSNLLNGTNTAVSYSSPVQLGSRNWSSVGGGRLSSFAIDSTGRLYGWGDHLDGRLGINTQDAGQGVRLSSPVQISCATNWCLIARGQNSNNCHNIAINTSNELWTWGCNDVGQLGLPRRQWGHQPASLGANRGKFSIGPHHGLAISSDDNQLYVWGCGQAALGIDNDAFMFVSSETCLDPGAGFYDSPQNQVTPRLISVPGETNSSWSMVSAGACHSAAITTLGRLYLWGTGHLGQLGDTSVCYKSVVGGGTNTWAIDINDNLWSWGANASTATGLLGNNMSRGNHYFRTRLGTGTWRCVFNSGWLTLAIDSNFKLFTWGGLGGIDLGMTLGLNGTTGRSSPTQVGSLSWTAISAARVSIEPHVLGITSTGNLFSWGCNLNGQLGTGTTINQCSPVQIGSGNTWCTVSAGCNHSLALTTGLALWAWGRNNYGQLGDNSLVNKSSPVLIPGAWCRISAGNQHSLGINSAGTLHTWGAGTSGVVGDGTTVTKSNPIAIGTNSWTSISAGTSGFNAAIRLDCTLWTWGDGSQGQLGWGFSTNRCSPTQINGSWTFVNAGSGRAYAIEHGTCQLWGWGAAITCTVSAPRGVYSLSFGTDVTTNRSSPVQVQAAVTNRIPKQLGTGSWTAVSAGGFYTLGICSNGTMWGWGQNSSGQLGIGATARACFSPIQIGAGTWSRVSAGTFSSAAINTSGQLFTWGIGTTGQLGDNTTISKSSPVQISGSWSLICAGGGGGLNLQNADTMIATAAGVGVDGRLYTWGKGTGGILGDNSTISKSSPVAIGTNTWCMIGATVFAASAIRNDGTLWIWGCGTYGQQGLNVSTNRSSPTQLGSGSFLDIGFGRRHTSAVCNNGSIYSWGRNDVGQFGNSALWNSTNTALAGTSSPTQVGLFCGSINRLPGSWTRATVGTAHSLAICSTGALYGWGCNAFGQLGDNTTINKSSPVLIGSGSSWSLISTSHVSTTIGTNAGGCLFAWGCKMTTGNNLCPYRPCGPASTNTCYSSPVLVSTSCWTVIGGTGFVSTGISAGRLFIWGCELWNMGIGMTGCTTNQLNVECDTYHVTSPVLIASRLTRSSPTTIGTNSWTAISAGWHHFLALRTNNTLWAWGGNNWGQLGINSRSDTSSPTQIGSGSWNKIAGGALHSLAISSTGTLWAWGQNETGQLGDNSLINRSSPVQIGSSSWSVISAGGAVIGAQVHSHFSLGITNLGQLFSWGSNRCGTLGNITLSTLTCVSSPAQIGTDSWITVSAGFTHSLGIKLGGTLWAWGDNSGGQLGLGFIAARSSPNQVGTDSWTSVSAGCIFSHAAGAGGVWAWGFNTSGQLGDNSIINRCSPVLIRSGSICCLSESNKAINTAAIIDSSRKLWTWGCGQPPGFGGFPTTPSSSPVQFGSQNWCQITFTRNSIGGITSV